MSKERGRPFVPGNRMGHGRPKGSRNKTKSTLAVERLLADHGEAITSKCIVKAMQGDPVALRLCMERLLPARRDGHVRLRVRPLKTGRDVQDAMERTLQAVTQGQITPQEGETISTLLNRRRDVLETAELEARIDKLEQMQASTGRKEDPA